MKDDMEKLVKKLLQGEVQALSRLISLVEVDVPEVPEIMQKVHSYLGKAFVVGVTGPSGAGKSTLVDSLTRAARNKGLTVGIIAADPTSHFTGGAILGDRIRMQQHYLDTGVFIRSMATRGSRGGLPQTVRCEIKLLDAYGKDLIFVETVGVGQTELDIVEIADSIIVVLVPEAGDAVQMMKAGLIEIADIFVINKADRQGADRLALELESMRSKPRNSKWEPPVIATKAVNNAGIEELYQAVERHQDYLQTSGELIVRRQQQRRDEFLHRVEQRLQSQLSQFLRENDKLLSLVDKVDKSEIDPYTAADIMEKSLGLSKELAG